MQQHSVINIAMKGSKWEVFFNREAKLILRLVPLNGLSGQGYFLIFAELFFVILIDVQVFRHIFILTHLPNLRIETIVLHGKSGDDRSKDSFTQS